MNKNIIITAIVALVVSLIVGFVMKSNQSNDGLVGSVRTVADQFSKGIVLGEGNGVVRNAVRVSIPAKSNQVSWKNTTGGTVYVDNAEIILVANSAGTATASSTFKVYIATSSSATISNDYTAPFASLVNGWLWATSTTATTTSSIGARRLLNTGVVPVAHNEYVVWQLQAQDSTQCQTLLRCETATSTNRGFDMTGRLFYHN